MSLDLIAAIGVQRRSTSRRVSLRLLAPNVLSGEHGAYIEIACHGGLPVEIPAKPPRRIGGRHRVDPDGSTGGGAIPWRTRQSAIDARIAPDTAR
jgi:hypothetical protein